MDPTSESFMLDYSNACILSGFMSLAMSLFVYSIGRRKKANLIWSGFCAAVFLWGVGEGMMSRSNTFAAGLAWQTWFNVPGAILLAIFLMHFVDTVLNASQGKVVKVGYGIAGLLLVFNFTNLFASVKPYPPYHYVTDGKWVYNYLFLPYFVLYVFYPQWLLIRKFLKSEGQTRNQIKYILLATSLGIFAGITDFLPSFNVPIPPYGVFFVPLYIIVMVYAIFKHRVMDIDLLARNVLTVVGTTACLIAPFLLVSLLWRDPWVPPVLLIASVSVFVRFYTRFQPVVETFVDRYVLRDRYSYLAGFKNMARENRQVRSLREFLPNLTKDVILRAQVRSCTVLILLEELASRPRFQTTALLDDDGGILLTEEWREKDARAMMNYLRRHENVVLREDAQEEKAPFGEIDKQFFEAAVPLRVHGRMFGLIAVGPKTGRARLFNQEDMKALEGLAEAITGGLWARIEHYEQIMRVETGLHDAINYFSMTGMALQTPGLEKKGQSSLMLGQDLLQDLRCFNQMAMVQQLDEKKERQAMDLAALCRAAVKSHSAAAAAKGIQLVFQEKGPVPVVLGETGLMSRCILNVVGYAVRSASRGKIELRLQTVGSGEVTFEVWVEDAVLPQESLPYLFDPFYRVPGKEGLSDATGLSLAIVKEYMTSLGGKVEALSKPAEGTRLRCSIPGAESAPKVSHAA